jgi:glycopeptide antibiotics resistance protein
MLTPGQAFPDVAMVEFQDKIVHFIFFFLLAYLWVGVGIQKKTQLLKNRRLWINFLVFALLPGIALETAQHLIPFRTFDWIDLTINGIGIFSGLLGYLSFPSCKFILD